MGISQEQLPAHSPLGASSAERWMNCPGSVSLSQGWQDEESDHAKVGTAAHALAAHCLTYGKEPWQFVGKWVRGDGQIMHAIQEGTGIDIDKEMADAVSAYTMFVRDELIRPAEAADLEYFIERRFHCPSIHKAFFGTSDAGAVLPKRKLIVADYKHGAGIVVDAEENVQLMYYASGVLEAENLWPHVDEIELVIVQPRAFHHEGPIRRWTISREALVVWLEEELVPAMCEAEVSRNTKSGEHCRFCPARLGACPQLLKDVEEMEGILELAGKDGKGVGALTAEQLGRFLDLGEVFKIVRTAALKTATVRAQNGNAIPGWKLGKARSNREFKDGAEAAAVKEFGNKAFTEPTLKSPAQIDELPGGTGFTTRWAHKPDKGETLIPASDSRPAIDKTTKPMFTPLKKR